MKSNHTLKTEKISLSLKAKLFFQPQHMEFLIFCFPKIPQSFSNYFEVHKCESMENALKIKVFRKSILFFIYLHNGSLDHPVVIHYRLKFYLNPHKKRILESLITGVGDMPHKNQLYWPYFIHSSFKGP